MIWLLIGGVALIVLATAIAVIALLAPYRAKSASRATRNQTYAGGAQMTVPTQVPSRRPDPVGPDGS